MGFRNGAFARIWSVEDKGNFSTGNLSTSKKNKDTEKYETDFQDGYVRFVGDAHKAIKNIEIPDKGVSVKISSCEVTNKYDPNKKTTYVNYAIFDMEVQDEINQSSGSKKTQTKAKKAVEVEEDNDLPF